jgi:hypothetical protein
MRIFNFLAGHSLLGGTVAAGREERRRASGPVQDWYAEARLRPIELGLPMTIWVSERGNERHDVRVKVCRVHGAALQWDNAAGIGVRPQPHVAAGHLAPGDFDAVSRWIVLKGGGVGDGEQSRPRSGL